MRNRFRFLTPVLCWLGAVSPLAAASPNAAGGSVLPPVSERFAAATGEEVPSFQRHVVNLFGRLGCNSRACHGSFQGQGGFRLSLFGYDFQADHDALLEKDHPRVDRQQPDESLIIAKPTDADLHEGGQRYKKGSWQHHLLRRWIEAGAQYDEQPERLVRLDVTPAEIWFQQQGEQVSLQPVAVWPDGTREDVTPLCRFVTNSEPIATVDANGRVTAVEAGDTHIVVSYDNAVVPVPVIRPVTDKTGARYPAVPAPTRIDELVVAKLRKLGIVPSALCTDAEFLRRVRLDMTGTLPTAEEVERFLADQAPDKRATKINELLATPAYAAWWATRLCDFTGNSDELLNNATPFRGSAAQEWYDWIHKRVAENMPYDQLVAGIVTAVSRQPGQDYRQYCQQMSALYRDDSGKSYEDLPCLSHYWARRDFRDPEARAVAFAYSFLGIRIQCAQCHKHPFDQWSRDDFHQFKNFFASVTAAERGADQQSREQYDRLLKDLGLRNLRGNDLRKQLAQLLNEGKTVPFPEIYVASSRPPQGRKAKPDATSAGRTARLLGGEPVDISQYDDPRTVVMDWLRDKANPYFARAFANRVWAAYFNVGIVNPPDDNSLGNPPSNRPLLDYLAEGFIASGFDMKWLHRQIANSRTYQLSWQPNDTNRRDETNFSHAIPRRLPAEVAYDALRIATAADAKAASLQTEMRDRAIAIPGSAARSNRLGNAAYALTTFGRSTRISNCECDRSSDASLLQTVYLQNDRDLLQLLETRPDSWVGQMAAQLKPTPTAAARPDDFQAKRARNLSAQIEALTAKWTRRKDEGDTKTAAQLAERLATLKQQLARLQPPAPAKPVTPEVARATTREIVTQAYLRTLSRYPNDQERARAEQYLTESEDPLQGLRDVLWALVNSKEFIVNH